MVTFCRHAIRLYWQQRSLNGKTRVVGVGCRLIAALFICYAFSFHQVKGQTLNNLRSKSVAVSGMSVLLDTLSLVPNSVQVYRLDTLAIVPETDYAINHASATLNWNTLPVFDSVRINYRVLPFLLTKPYSNKDTLSVIPLSEQPAGYYEYLLRNKQQTGTDFFNMGGLDYSGSFGRGITIGSNQDATINANFNLQMSGKLPGDIDITAALTDNNIPFQPEGNTQQIQEFDRIYIQLKKNKHSLLLGDYDLKTPANNYFMQYVRRLQGITAASGISFGKNKNELSVSASGAVARGSYHRMVINGLEGNQGPYRLTGANGETFIIVLSGSERVFIDGKLLTRGANLDYIIDYNTAEISFTPQQIINKDKRITIEFQYTNQTYLRSLLQSSVVLKQKKTAFRVNYFSEQDAKNQLLADLTLPDNYLDILENVGNDIENAVLPGWQNTGFNPDRVMYQLIDSMVNNILYDSIFIYSVNPAKALYSVSFSFVGAGNGDYNLSEGNVNGRIFNWVAPDSISGLRKGSFVPLVKIITPKRNRMISAAMDYAPDTKHKISTEIALSQNDLNTFSDKNNDQNSGIAARLSYQNNITLNKSKNIKLLTNLHYEFVQDRFDALEPFREIEFARNWSLATTDMPANEHLGNVSAQVKFGNNSDVRYQIGAYLKGVNVYKGTMHTVNARYKSKNGWSATMNMSYMNSEMANNNASKFFRPNGEISKSFRQQKWQVGLKGEQEKNQTTQSDTLTLRSFYYNQIEAFAKTSDTSANRFAVSFIKRWDYAPKSENFTLSNTGNTFNFNGAFSKNPRSQLLYSFTYRNLQVADTSVLKAVELNTLLGEINFTKSVGKGWLRTTTQYQIGSGQRQQTEYYYEKVSNGMGNYVWIDNGNEIEELDEFFPATENNMVEAFYIRLLLPTGSYQPTNIVQFNQSINITPKAVWFNETGIKKVVSLFSTQSAITIRRESVLKKWQAYLPIGGSEDLDQIVAESVNIQNALFLNRNSPKWELNVQQLYLVNTNFLINGIDRRTKTEWKPAGRFSPTNKISIRLSANKGNLGGNSQAFISQNYQIRYWSIDPAADLVLNKKFRLTGAYTFKNSADYLTENYFPAKQQKLSLDTQFGNAVKSNVSARISYVLISYKGPVNTPAAYNLLEGLQPGSNYLWSVSFNTRLANNMQLNFGYDGRKAGSNKINHTGRASIQAVF